MRPPEHSLFTPTLTAFKLIRHKRIDARALTATVAALLLVVLALGVTPEANAQTSPDLTFSQSFSTNPIGPTSTTTLTFIISDPPGPPAQDVAFTDVLPAGVFIATPSSAFSDCLGVLSAPDGGGTISLTGGRVGANSSCTISVNVTSSVVGTHTNNAGVASSSNIGNSSPSSEDLVVDGGVPGLSKSFSPSTIPPGGTSQLTFTIDNSANPAAVAQIVFNDNMPAGMIVATPANASTTCGGVSPVKLTADSGSNTIQFSAPGSAIPGFEAMAAGATCTVTVDVTAPEPGVFVNTSEELADTSPPTLFKAGFGTAALNVPITTLIKSFTDDPAVPGGDVTLEFSILNPDRVNAATDISFSDDLDAALSGLLMTAFSASQCGGTVSTSDGGMTIDFNDGSLPPEGSCTITVTLTVPAGAAAATYTNTTTAISLDFGAGPELGNTATDELVVEPAPVLTKEFTDDPVSAGDTVTLKFTIENTSTISPATGIAFTDELTTHLPTPVSVTLPSNGFCGAGSSMVLEIFGSIQQRLSMTGGELGIGGTCTFEVTIDIPTSIANGIYPNLTSNITATVDGSLIEGLPATDDLVIVAPPNLSKSFSEELVVPGSQVTLAFTLTHSPNAPGNATDISFTDDLNAVLAGTPELTVSGTLPSTPCGAGSSLTESGGVLTFADGILTPGTDCTFSLTLDVPAGAAIGTHTNTTSDITAVVSSMSVTGNPATADLTVASLIFTKKFIPDVVLAGGTVTLEFTYDNTLSTEDATLGSAIAFCDNLGAPSSCSPTAGPMLLGLAATGPPSVNTCGGTLTGTENLTYTGGSVDAGMSCTISVDLLVPAGAEDDTYTNTTTGQFVLLGTTLVEVPPATAPLTVASGQMVFSKSFGENAVLPGGAVTLDFTVTNLDALNGITDIAFMDDLDAALSGLVMASQLSNDCGPAVSGTGVIDFSGGSLAAGASCTISVSLSVPAGAPLGAVVVNTTTEITGKIGSLDVSGDPAIDEIQIGSVTFTKAFDGPTTGGGTPKLTFTIKNEDTANAVTNLGFLDDFDAMILGTTSTSGTVNNVCGAGSKIEGTNPLVFTNGSLAAGATCSFDVDLLVPATAEPGDYVNTSNLVVNGTVISTATATLTVIVVVNQPPVADAGEVPTLECTSSDGAEVTLDGTGSSDPDDDNLTFFWTAPGITFDDATSATPTATFPLGATTVTLTVDDGNGETDTDEVIITVEDTTGPVITVEGDPIVLWPPNHKYETIDLSAIVTDVTDTCDASVSTGDVAITSTDSDEEEDAQGGGDGNTDDDMVISGDCLSVDVRAERQGSGNGRVYTIHMDVSDASSNVGVASFQVQVPKSKNGSPAVDDGAVYTVTCGSSKTEGNVLTDVSADEETPETFVLHQNYPNPFNPETRIRFGVPETAQVTLVVYDVLGRQVKVLVDGVRKAGTYEAVFEAGNLPSGTYIYRLSTPQGIFVQTMLLLK